MFNKLHFKMIFRFTLYLFISLSTISFINYMQVSKQVDSDIRFNATEQTNELKGLVDIYLNQYSLTIHQFSQEHSLHQFVSAKNPKQKQLAWKNLKENFVSFLELNPEIQTIYIGDEIKNMDLVPEIELTGFDPTGRPWYVSAKETPNEVIWTDPYIDQATNDYVITAAKAILDKSTNKVLGVVGIDISLDELEAMVSNVTVSHNGFAFLIDQDGRALIHPTLRGEDLSDLSFIKELYQSEEQGIINYHSEEGKQVIFYNSLDVTGWKIGTAFKLEELNSTANTLRNSNIIITTIIIAISVVFIYITSVKISRPITKLTENIDKVAGGDFTVHFTSTSKDEVGALADSLNMMVSDIRELIEAVKHSSLVINTSSENLSAISEETTASNEEVARAIVEIANGSTGVAHTCDATNQRTTELSSLIENVTEQIQNIKALSSRSEGENEKGVKQIEQLRSSADQSNSVIASIENVIHNLTSKINDIEKIMNVISSISAQTNLLALNASIEAARAGEHGRGFAVVANEVRKLADESNKATEEVRQTLLMIQNEASHAVQEMVTTKAISNKQNHSVVSTEKAFSAISDVTYQMINSIETIASKMNEVNGFKEEVVASIQQISSMTQESASASEEVSASVDEQISAIRTVAEQAQSLSQSSEELEKLIQKFRLT